MKAKLFIVGLLAATSSMSASAVTFQTSVDVTKENTPISIAQKTAMVLPAVRIDESSEDGKVICATYYEPFPGKNYCSGASANGVYTVSGSPHAEVSVAFDQSAAITDGFSFQIYNTMNNAAGGVSTIGADGNVDIEMRGDLKLEDKSAVTSQNYVFDINMTAVYN